ncbi:hypothetical protein K8I85_02110, partial [bacterium]|nr:hypothetical protein [bacterium]
RPEDALLAVEVALTRLWKLAKEAWRKRHITQEGQDVTADRRVPTFIVVDEAHNFAPEQIQDPLRQRVANRLIQIASEGRKYGLYLILATQRPTKLHRSLVPECENSCVLRLLSQKEKDFAHDVMGVTKEMAAQASDFTQGQGLIVGQWIDHPIPVNAKFAPARSTVGGGGLPNTWRDDPAPTPEFLPPTDQREEIAHHVRDMLEASESAVPLASIAWELRAEFGDDLAENWLGHQFKQLIRSLAIPDLALATSTPPGFAYLSGRHAIPEAGGRPQLAGPSAEIMETAREVARIPQLEVSTFRAVMEILSEELQNSEFSLTEISKAVRDRCNELGVKVARQPISFIIKGIGYSGHRFDPDLPQSPEVLGTAFADSVVESMRRMSHPLTAEDEGLLREHVSGGYYKSLDVETVAVSGGTLPADGELQSSGREESVVAAE